MPDAPMAFEDRLTLASAHIERANGWAAERFRLFPQISSISLDIGVSFGIQLGVYLTWERRDSSVSQHDNHLEEPK